jgi:hypothetical protein
MRSATVAGSPSVRSRLGYARSSPTPRPTTSGSHPPSTRSSARRTSTSAFRDRTRQFPRRSARRARIAL